MKRKSAEANLKRNNQTTAQKKRSTSTAAASLSDNESTKFGQLEEMVNSTSVAKPITKSRPKNKKPPRKDDMRGKMKTNWASEENFKKMSIWQKEFNDCLVENPKESMKDFCKLKGVGLTTFRKYRINPELLGVLSVGKRSASVSRREIEEEKSKRPDMRGKFKTNWAKDENKDRMQMMLNQFNERRKNNPNASLLAFSKEMGVGLTTFKKYFKRPELLGYLQCGKPSLLDSLKGSVTRDLHVKAPRDVSEVRISKSNQRGKIKTNWSSEKNKRKMTERLEEFKVLREENPKESLKSFCSKYDLPVSTFRKYLLSPELLGSLKVGRKSTLDKLKQSIRADDDWQEVGL